MGRRSTVDSLPESVRRWLERALTDGNFTGYQMLEDELHQRGYIISKSAIHRYGKKIEKRFADIKASTEIARIMAEGAGDDQDVRSGAIVAMVQTGLIDAMFELQDAIAQKDMPIEKRVALYAEISKKTSPLIRVSVSLKKYQADVQARAAAAAANVEKIAKTGGLSAESVDALRREILGIAS